MALRVQYSNYMGPVGIAGLVEALGQMTRMEKLELVRGCQPACMRVAKESAGFVWFILGSNLLFQARVLLSICERGVGISLFRLVQTETSSLIPSDWLLCGSAYMRVAKESAGYMRARGQREKERGRAGKRGALLLGSIRT